MSLYGYCRISTGKQSIERQIRNIKAEYPNAIIIQDTYTGTGMDRQGWNKLVRAAKPGDTIVFDSVSRMSRNAEDGYISYADFYAKGINLVFLKEPHINTEVYKRAHDNQIPMTGTDVDMILDGINKYLFYLAKEQIQIAFNQSEKEVRDLHQRTKEGIETARLNGKQIGGRPGVKLTTKKSISSKEIILKHSKDFNGSLDDTDVIKICGIARGTYYKYKKELRCHRQ